MKHFRRKTAFILLALLMLGVIAFYYINNTFIPIKFKHFLTTKIHQTINRDVAIGQLQFEPIKGFILKDIKIYQKDLPHKTLIHIKEVSFNVLLAPILKNKKIIIPSLTIAEPFAHITRDKNKEWTFSDLITKKKEASPPSSWQVLLGKINLHAGAIDYIDQTPENIFRESIKNIHLNVNISPLEKIISCSLELRLPNRRAAFTASGDYNVSSKKFSAKTFAANIPLAEYLSLFTQQENIPLKSGAFSSSKFEVFYDGSEFEARGNFALDNASLLFQGKQALTGTIQSPDIWLNWHNQQLSGRGQINIPEASLTINTTTTLQGNISAEITSLLASSENISSQGNLTINAAHLKINDKILDGNLSSDNVSFSQKNQTTQITGNVHINETHFRFDEEKSFQGNLSAMNTVFHLTDKGLNLQSRLNAENAIIKITKDKEFRGSPKINLTYHALDQHPADYTGTLMLEKAELYGMPYFPEIKNIQGSIAFSPNTLKTPSLTLTIQDAPAELSGSLINFTQPEINLTLATPRLDLPKALSFFPPHIQKKIPLDLTGYANIQASYIGLLSAPEEARITVTSQLRDATLNTKILKNITAISGKILYEKDLLTWDNLHGTYNNTPFILNGQLDDFSRPIITTQLSAQNIKLSAKINLLKKAFRLVSLEGQILDSSLDIKGDVHFFDDADPDLDFKGEFTLDPKDLWPMLPASFQEKIKPFNPKGLLSGEGLFRGKPHRWRDWQLAFNLTAPQIEILGHPFHETTFQIIQRDHHISKFNITSTIHNGTLALTSSADLLEENIPADISLHLENFDLSLWRKNSKIKNRDLAGQLSLLTTLTGPLKDLNSLTGTGSLSIVNGYLGRLVKIYPNAFFTDARADFIIQDQKAITENGELSSRVVDLNAKGRIDFKKNIYFDVVPNVGKIMLSKKEGLSIDPSFLLREAVSLTCTGPIDKPKCQPNASPVRVLENTSDFILKGMGSLLEELF